MKPLLLRGGLSGAVYVVTRYKERPDGTIVACQKYDVTDQFHALITHASFEDIATVIRNDTPDNVAYVNTATYKRLCQK